MLSTALALSALLNQAPVTLPSVDTPVTTPVVRQIVIQGNKRTRNSVIRNELDTRPGDRFDPRRWADDVQSVKDLNLFWTTETTMTTRPGSVDLYLTVEDKWTLIPSFGFTSTPDVLEWYAGVYDANLFGLNMEAGGVLYRKRGGNSYHLWYTNRRFGDTPIYLELQAQRNHALHIVYDQDADTDRATGYYETFADVLSMELGRRLDDRGYTRIAILYQPSVSEYELWNHEEDGQVVNETTGFERPPARFIQQLGLRFQWGVLNQEDYLFFGHRLDAVWLTVPSFLPSTRRYTRASVQWKQLFRPLGRHNLGYRLFVGRTTSPWVTDLYSMGGLYEVRGFKDERFIGQNVWYANVEYRLPVVDNRWLLGQVVPFVDAGNTWNDTFASGDAFRRIALTAGGGIRLIVKPLIATKLRVDYGWALQPYRTGNLSLGIEQFF